MITTVADDAVIKNVRCACSVDVTKRGVTIENSDLSVSGPNSWVISLRHASDTTIAQNDLHGNGVDAPSGCDSAVRDIYGDSDHLTMKNNDVWYCADPMNNISDGGLIAQNYFHDLGASDLGNHYEDIQLEPGDGKVMTIRNNTFLNDNAQTAAIILSTDGGGSETNRVIDHNLLAGGDYCFYGGGTAADRSSHILFTHNVFSVLYFPRCGYFGPRAYWTSGNGNVWSDNIWAGSGRRVAP